MVERTSTAKNFAEAYNGLGVALREMGEFDEALVVLDKVLDLNPKAERAPASASPLPLTSVENMLRSKLITPIHNTTSRVMKATR
jgi:tetratricopeptide (TPR) repeat protein